MSWHYLQEPDEETKMAETRTAEQIATKYVDQMSTDDKRGIRAAGSAEAWRSGISIQEGIGGQLLDDTLAEIPRLIEGLCPVCHETLPVASRDRRVTSTGVVVCGRASCEEAAADLPPVSP